MINKFFVYGLLKKDEPIFKTLQLEKAISNIQEAEVKGKLYNIANMCPGLKLDGNNIIKGEIQTYKRRYIKNIIRLFDNIEKYYPKEEDKSMYIRKKIKIGKYRVWVYECNLKTLGQNFEEIKEGVW